VSKDQLRVWRASSWAEIEAGRRSQENERQVVTPDLRRQQEDRFVRTDGFQRIWSLVHRFSAPFTLNPVAQRAVADGDSQVVANTPRRERLISLCRGIAENLWFAGLMVPGMFAALATGNDKPFA
jgi:hypothetical protein